MPNWWEILIFLTVIFGTYCIFFLNVKYVLSIGRYSLNKIQRYQCNKIVKKKKHKLGMSTCNILFLLIKKSFHQKNYLAKSVLASNWFLKFLLLLIKNINEQPFPAYWLVRFQRILYILCCVVPIMSK